MKRILTTIALAFATLFAFGQDVPAGVRMEVCEVEQDEIGYSIFTYKDEDGDFGYYLGMDNAKGACICMGTTSEEALAFLESLLEFIEEDAGTTAKFPCRLTSINGKLTGHGTATCVVTKRFLQGKQLSLSFTGGQHTISADLTKSAVKSLRWSFKLGQKSRPTT